VPFDYGAVTGLGALVALCNGMEAA
jgi:hypothetical protein